MTGQPRPSGTGTPPQSLPTTVNQADLTRRIDVSLLSHTNVGKTTLARTLLRRDIGEVGDRPHVTDIAESDVLIQTAEGDSLVLWDTPGFGDSARLLKRLQQGDGALGWFLSQVWDRFADRPFWCGQQAVRVARDTSDVVLYVGNASEQPASAPYVDAELQILEWMGKPVILLLNQLGPAMSAEADVSLWTDHVARFPQVKCVLPFDAFARCWVQEGTLLAAVQSLLPAHKSQSFERLREAWRRRNLEVFHRSMEVLAQQVATIACDVESIADPALYEKARAWLGSVTGEGVQSTPELERAERALAARLDKQVRRATGEWVALHGLTGKATDEVLQRMGREFTIDRPADADKASVLGGIMSGALGGLAADLHAGGLTFGAGALIGGLLGAFGARGVAKAYNLARGSRSGVVRWSPDFLTSRLAAALIRYLAVAHFGRGRGDFVAGAAPAAWLQAVNEALEKRRSELQALWSAAAAQEADKETKQANFGTGAGSPSTAAAGNATTLVPVATAATLVPVASACAQEVLVRLYPDSGSMFR